MKNLVLALAVMLSFGACAADDGIFIPNCDSDVKIAVDRISRIEDGQERESNCQTYLDLAEKLMKRAKEHDIPLKKSRYFILARGCFEVVKGCGRGGITCCPARAGAEAEGYSPPEDMKTLAEKGIALCNGGLAGQLRLPGIEPGGNAENIIAGLRSKTGDSKKQVIKSYLEAAKYYEGLSKACDGPDRAEYGTAAMSCYLIVSEVDPDPKASNEAWAGYKRCGAYTASCRPGKAM
ncbi:MAG: hypothetical protein WC324_02280 [Candidatus Omnitrophota bacterium]|jgi:hypothetical protein